MLSCRWPPGAVSISMLVIGRVLLGLAVGFTSLVITGSPNART